MTVSSAMAALGTTFLAGVVLASRLGAWLGDRFAATRSIDVLRAE